MNIPVLGLTITRTKAVKPLSRVESRGGWWPILRESFSGAWQTNTEIVLTDVLTYSTVFSCITLIASDIAKMRLRLVELDDNGVWTEKDVPSYSPVLRKPNRYQTRIKFIEQWIVCKLVYGNTYVLKERDGRGVVTGLYLLDPQRVQVLVGADGSVWYQVKRDDLSGLPLEQYTFPAREVIHDLMVALYHPLIGVSPITACGLSAMQALKIQNNSSKFFENGANPSGILTAPGVISETTANALKDYWNTNFVGDNAGKVAVVGDGLKYEPMTMTAVDAELIAQLKMTSEFVCSVFHVPPYMVGVGPPPNYNNIQALSMQYYTQCIQTLVESLEAALDEGLGLGPPLNRYGSEFDTDDLLRMDSATMIETISKGVDKAIYTPNEGRRKVNLKPVAGGNTPYLQQQMWSLEALNKRDQAPPTPPLEPGPPPPPDENSRALTAVLQQLLPVLTQTSEIVGEAGKVFGRSSSPEAEPDDDESLSLDDIERNAGSDMTRELAA